MTIGSRFDWYEMTWEGWDDAASTLALALGGKVERVQGRNGYGFGHSVVVGDDELVRVYGGSARVGELHAVTSGASCDQVVPLLRRLWPDHRVSRADSSVDMLTDFEQLDRRAVDFAEARGLSYRLVTDSAGGATRYLGAPSSEVQVRVYKKTEQLRALHPERAALVPDGLVRVELQDRPSKRVNKQAVATMDADGLWGMGRWVQAFALELLHTEVPFVQTQWRRPSDWKRGLYYLGVQYGRLVRERACDVGEDAVMAELREALGLGEPSC